MANPNAHLHKGLKGSNHEQKVADTALNGIGLRRIVLGLPEPSVAGPVAAI
jgi:hypothetical protein